MAGDDTTIQSRGNGQRAGAARRPLRVLIVEDELIIAWELSELVAQFGHKVVGTAVDQAEAMELAARLRPDLILMDVWLRRGDNGIDTAQAIRATLPARVVFITAYAEDPRTRARMQAIDPVRILSKPILVDDLRHALDAAAEGEHG